MGFLLMGMRLDRPKASQYIESAVRIEFYLVHEVSHEIYVVIHPAEEGGYWSEVPAIPGCGSQGETLEEVKRHTVEAIEGCVLSLTEEGCGDKRTGNLRRY